MSWEVVLVLAFTSLGAATVNGALGYGYSSISVPIALLVVAGRVLSPALVMIGDSLAQTNYKQSLAGRRPTT